MDLETIQNEWLKDGPIQPTLEHISNQSIRVFELHHKYWKMLSAERQLLRKLEFDFKKVQILLDDWVDGTLTNQEIKEYGLESLPKATRTALDKRNLIETHAYSVKAALALGEQKEKVEFLQDIIKSIHNRGFQIKNWIEVERFKNGGH